MNQVNRLFETSCIARHEIKQVALVRFDLARHGAAINPLYKLEIGILLVGPRPRNEELPVGIERTPIETHPRQQIILPGQVSDGQRCQTMDLVYYPDSQNGTPGWWFTGETPPLRLPT